MKQKSWGTVVKEPKNFLIKMSCEVALTSHNIHHHKPCIQQGNSVKWRSQVTTFITTNRAVSRATLWSGAHKSQHSSPQTVQSAGQLWTLVAEVAVIITSPLTNVQRYTKYWGYVEKQVITIIIRHSRTHNILWIVYRQPHVSTLIAG